MSNSEIDYKELRALIKRKYLKNWEWKSTTRLPTSKNYYLEVWMGEGKAKVSIKILATIDDKTWTAVVEYKKELGPRSAPNELREKAVDEALKLWWSDFKKPNEES